MTKKLLFLLFFGASLLRIPVAQAQTDFRPGYIVELSGDTVRGLADYRGALRSTRRCEFKTAPGAATRSYLPSELRGYGFPGQKDFRSRLTPLPDSAGLPQTSRLFFLEVLVSGPASLYARRDRADITHYYLQKQTSAQALVSELLFRRDKIEKDGSVFLRDVNTFRGTLNEAFADCQAVLPEVERALFKPSSLIGVVTSYNRCVQPATAVKKSKSGSKARLGVVVGAQVSKLVFDGDTYQSRGHFVASPAPVLGLALHYVNPAINEKLAFRVEATYAQQYYEDEYAYPSSFPESTEQSRFTVGYVRLPVALRYTAPGARFRPLVELGFALGQATKIEAERRERFVTTLPYGDWKPAFADKNIRTLETGVFAGVGVQLPYFASQPLSVVGRVERSSGIVTAVGYETFVWRYQLLLGMNLFH